MGINFNKLSYVHQMYSSYSFSQHMLAWGLSLQQVHGHLDRLLIGSQIPYFAGHQAMS